MLVSLVTLVMQVSLFTLVMPVSLVKRVKQVSLFTLVMPVSLVTLVMQVSLAVKATEAFWSAWLLKFKAPAAQDLCQQCGQTCQIGEAVL